MSIDIIFNTCCMDPLASIKHNPWREGSYAHRKEMLGDSIEAVPTGIGVIVAGAFTGDQANRGYLYVQVDPIRRNRTDALQQRELGARHSTADVMVFCHDDHRPGEGFFNALESRKPFPSWDILVPKRIHGITGEEMENGRKDGYMGGHCLVMRRWLWARVPWTSCDTAFWDIPMTALWREAGGTLVHTDELVHIDIEVGADEE